MQCKVRDRHREQEQEQGLTGRRLNMARAWEMGAMKRRRISLRRCVRWMSGEARVRLH